MSEAKELLKKAEAARLPGFTAFRRWGKREFKYQFNKLLYHGLGKKNR